MAKEKILTLMVPIRDEDCESGVYTQQTLPTPSAANINKIYRMNDGSYRRLWYNPTLEYHAVTDREFPYLGKPMEIGDFTYDATRMGQAPTISAQGVMWYADYDAVKDVYITLEDLWTQEVYVIFDGEPYHLKRIPTSSKSNEDARYKYDIDFVSDRVVLEQLYLYDVVSPFETAKPVTESAVFSFFGDVSELVKRINASLVRSGLATLARKHEPYPDMPGTEVPYLSFEQWNTMGVDPLALVTAGVFPNAGAAGLFRNLIYNNLHGDYNAYLMQYIYDTDPEAITGYKCMIGDDKYGNPVTSEEKLITFDKNYIYDALQEFHNTFDLQYYIVREKGLDGTFTGNTIIWVADCETDFADWDEDADDYVRDAEGVPVSSDPLDYPKNADAYDEGNAGGLLFKEKTNTTDKIITRITGVGSSENIPWFYPNPTADGWIKPTLKTLGVAQDGVEIDYPTSEGDTIAETVRYEKYLKNRIGNNFTWGVVKGLNNTTDWFRYTDHVLRSPSSLYPEKYYEVIYKLQTCQFDLLTEEPSDWETNYWKYYTIDAHGDYYQLHSSEEWEEDKYYSITVLIADPKLTLKMLIDDNAKYSNFSIQGTTADGDTVIWGDYDSSLPYEDNPTPFQTMCKNRDESSYVQLGYQYYYLKIRFNITEASNSRIYSEQGYLYPKNESLMPSFEPYTDEQGFYHTLIAPVTPAHIGQNFYKQEGLFPYAVFMYPVADTVDNIKYHKAICIDAGYSTRPNDTDGSYKVNCMPRILFKQYKDISSGKIYRCHTAEQPDPNIGDPYGEPQRMNGYAANPKMKFEEWMSTFVQLRLSLYDADSWYLGSKAVDLADYGINGITEGGSTYTPDIFDVIEFSRVKYITPQPNLMPEVYIKTDGARRFYNAHNYLPLQDVPSGGVDTAIGEEVNGDDKVINNIYKENETDADDKHYQFENEYIETRPHEHIEDFDDVKPTIREQTIIIEGQEMRIDVMSEYAYDATDNDEIWESNDDGNVSGEYKHPCFFAKLRPLGFNIFDLALQDDMVITMETGNCGACKFRIAVDEKTRKNPVQIWEHDVYRGASKVDANKVYNAGDLRRYVDEFDLYYDTEDGMKPVNEGVNREGGMITGYPSTTPMYKYTYSEDDVENGLVGSLRKESAIHFEGDVMTSGKYIESLQDTSENEVWIALYKDTETYGVLMPAARPDYNNGTFSVYIRPASVADTGDEETADKFAILNIKLPQVYLRRAERKLSDKLVNFMYENNMQKFNSSINFSRIYFKDNEDDTDKINENSVLYVRFNNRIYRQYVKHYTYRMSHEESLPEVNVDMNEELPVTMTSAQRAQRAEKINRAQVSSSIRGVSGRVWDNTQAIRKQEMYPSRGGGGTDTGGSGDSGGGGTQPVAVQPDWSQTDSNSDSYVRNKPVVKVTSGERLYLNGVDVTDDPSMDPYIAAATGHWYGSQDAYDEIADNGELVPGMLYHVMVQADWNETDPSHLGYIKNKPNVMDMTVQNETAIFFYQ